MTPWSSSDRRVRRWRPRSTTTAVAIADEISVAPLWRELGRLHDAGIVHRRLDLDRIVVHPDGSLGFGDLSSASVAAEPHAKDKDRAQLIGLALLLDRRGVGDLDGARGARRRAPRRRPSVPAGGGHAAAPAGCPRVAGIELDDVRKRMGATLNAGDQDLIRLRRVTWGSILNLALLVFAAYALIGLIGGFDLETFVEALRTPTGGGSASPSSSPRSRASRRREHDGFDQPAAATRSADGVAVRHLLRQPRHPQHGRPCRRQHPLLPALRRGADGGRVGGRDRLRVSGSSCRSSCSSRLTLFSDFDMDLSFDTGDMSGLVTITLIIVGVIVVAAVVVSSCRRLRARLLDQPWPSPARRSSCSSRRRSCSSSSAATSLSQVLFGVAMAACVEAFGQDVGRASSC